VVMCLAEASKITTVGAQLFTKKETVLHTKRARIAHASCRDYKHAKVATQTVWVGWVRAYLCCILPYRPLGCDERNHPGTSS